MKWFNLLKPGTFKDANGNDITITANDLDNIARSYDSKKLAASFTIGHPKGQKEPSYGFAAALRRVGDMVQFTPGKLVAEFAAAVNEGKFPRVSAGLHKINDKWQLNHIAFLGAWVPAVDGLGMVEFAADGTGTIESDCDDWRPGNAEFAQGSVTGWIEGRFDTLSRILTGLREFIISKYDIETADKILNNYDLEYIGSPAPANVDEAITTSLASGDSAAPGDSAMQSVDYQALFAGAQTEITKISEAFATAHSRIAQLEIAAKAEFLSRARAEFAGFVDSKADKVYPAERDILVNNLVALSRAEMASAGADINTPEVIAYKRQIDMRPVHNLLREVATDGATDRTITVLELASCAQDYVAEMAEKGTKISYADAVGFVRANPERFKK